MFPPLNDTYQPMQRCSHRDYVAPWTALWIMNPRKRVASSFAEQVCSQASQQDRNENIRRHRVLISHRTAMFYNRASRQSRHYAALFRASAGAIIITHDFRRWVTLQASGFPRRAQPVVNLREPPSRGKSVIEPWQIHLCQSGEEWRRGASDARWRRRAGRTGCENVSTSATSLPVGNY